MCIVSLFDAQTCEGIFIHAAAQENIEMLHGWKSSQVIQAAKKHCSWS